MIDSSETVFARGGPGAAVQAGPAGSRPGRIRSAAGGVLRRHWALALLLTAGLALRILTQIAYQPALLFIDSKKYIFGTDLTATAWGSYDPIGYTLLVLRPVLMFANLGFVALAQHGLGLAMAVALYALMLRRGVARWLAALAVAPVLLDAYQLNAEQTIMPDVLFQALVVAGLVVLAWQQRPGLGPVAAGGLLLGTSAPVRQVGEVLLVPALVFVLAATREWRTRLLHGTALAVCFALPVLAYMVDSDMILHYGFELSNMDDAYLRPGRARGRLRHAEHPGRPAPAVPGAAGRRRPRGRRAGQLSGCAERAVQAGRRQAGPAGRYPAGTARAGLRGAQAAAAAGGRRRRQGLGEGLRPDPGRGRR